MDEDGKRKMVGDLKGGKMKGKRKKKGRKNLCQPRKVLSNIIINPLSYHLPDLRVSELFPSDPNP